MDVQRVSASSLRARGRARHILRTVAEASTPSPRGSESFLRLAAPPASQTPAPPRSSQARLRRAVSGRHAWVQAPALPLTCGVTPGGWGFRASTSLAEWGRVVPSLCPMDVGGVGWAWEGPVSAIPWATAGVDGPSEPSLLNAQQPHRPCPGQTPPPTGTMGPPSSFPGSALPAAPQPAPRGPFFGKPHPCTEPSAPALSSRPPEIRS